MAALNRSISRLGEQGLPFFKLLKHQDKFMRTTEADQALAQLKDFLSKQQVEDQSVCGPVDGCS
jgi:hypothetical protein